MSLLEKVVKRGDQWCVIHCHGAEAGKAIKCFPTKPEADAMHRAIQAGKHEAYRHPDFNHILDEFNNYYCKGDPSCSKGEDEYYQWLNVLSLDENQRYGAASESFRWAKNMLQYLREDDQYKYYKVLIGFPIKSMNGNVYKERDLVAAALRLKGIHPSLNHKDEWHFTPDSRWGEITAEDARYEDGAIEAVLRVSKSAICPICDGKPMFELIDSKRIINVSLQGGCANPQYGGVCDGFQFDDKGFSLLTSDVLPGIPMARIFPLESIMVEALQTSTKTEKRRTNMKTIKMEVLEQDEEPEKDEHGCVVGKQKWDAESDKCVPITVGEVKEQDKRPPKDWMDTCKATVTKGMPSYSEDQVNAVCGNIWHNIPAQHGIGDAYKESFIREQMTQVIPVDVPVKKSVEPDEHGQCPEGTKINALGKCVETEDCGEGRHWDANANEGQGACVADTPPKPEAPETAVGISAAPKEDVLTSGPTEQPTPEEQPPITGTAKLPPSPAAGEEPSVTMHPPEPKEPMKPAEPSGIEPKPPHDCPDGYHFVPGAVPPCVPDEPIVERVKRIKAELVAKEAEEKLARWEYHYTKLDGEHQQLTGKYREQFNTINALRDDLGTLRKDLTKVEVDRDKFKRERDEAKGQRDDFAERAEELQRSVDEKIGQYGETLDHATYVSNKNTELNKEILGLYAKIEHLEAQLNKAKSISKKIWKIKV